MLTVDECLNNSNEWIKGHNLNHVWFVKAILEINNEYIVIINTIDENDINGQMDLPLFIIDKDEAKIRLFNIIEKGIFEKINASKVVYGKIDSEEE